MILLMVLTLYSYFPLNSPPAYALSRYVSSRGISQAVSAGERTEIMHVISNRVDRKNAGRRLEEFANKYGIKIVYDKPSEDSLRKNRELIILGGPDAYNGVGDIVREILSEEEQEMVRNRGSKMVFEKENPYNGGTVYVIAGSTRNDTMNSVTLDHDEDGIPTGLEAMLYNHPLEKSYGLIDLTAKGIKDAEALRLFEIVDRDGKFDKGERTITNVFYEIWSGSFMPEAYRKNFWSKEELEDYAKRFVENIVDDGKIGKDEVDAIRAMMNKFKWKDGRGGIIFDLIDGNVINSRNLNKDFDKDGYTNIDEIKEGYNPFNPWEWPGNKNGYSRVFYVGVDGTTFRDDPLLPFLIPMMMLKYGLQPDKIKILVQEEKGGGKMGTLKAWKDTKLCRVGIKYCWGWFAGKNVYQMFKDVGGKLYSLDETTTSEKFFEAIRESVKQMDGNDFLIIYYVGHGPVPGILKYGIKYTKIYSKDFNVFSWKDVSKILEAGKGYKIVIIDSCYAENAIRDNFNLSQAYFIGTTMLNEEGGGSGPIIKISTRLGEGYKIKDLFNKAKVCQDGSCEIGEVNPIKWVKKP